MRFLDDLFSKVLLQEALDTVSVVELQKLVVPSDAQYSDVFCEPRPNRPPKSEVPHLGLLWEMTVATCTIEPFSRTPTVADLRALARKQLGLHHQLSKAAEDESLPMPPQWILSPGLPHRALSATQAAPAKGWPTGFYRSGEFLEQWIVVLPELETAAHSPETRVLRLLGPPKLRQAAMAELARLPPSDPARQPLLEILSELIYLSRTQPQSAEPLSATESADMTELRREFEAFKASLRLEGEARGETKGRAEGKAEALLAVLSARGVTIPEVLRQQILACRDLTQLDRLLVQAATATSPSDVLIAAA